MWRSTIFPENEDSDQSISEDDDLNGELPEDHISLGVPGEKKGEVQVLSQLDMLRDAHEVMHERTQTSLLQKRQADLCVEDDVEFPIFAENGEFTYPPRKASACNSDEEILSDNEVGENGMNSSECSLPRLIIIRKLVLILEAIGKMEFAHGLQQIQKQMHQLI